MNSSEIRHITDDTFEPEVLQSETPVLVDYWAEWCGPCKSIAPILDEVAKEYQGRLKVAKINVDENQNTPAKFGIRGIPTLMLFKNGNVEATRVGALSKSQLEERLYGWDEEIASNAVEVHIHALRRKLDPALIRNVRGLGYSLEAAD